MVDAIVIGGGLAGIFSAWQLTDLGLEVVLLERKKYPFHRVCGEYVSNEVIPFLEHRGLFPHELGPAQIDKFKLTSVGGKSLDMGLDLGGFGISRYAWDQWLVEKLRGRGVQVMHGKAVNNVQEEDDHMVVYLQNGERLCGKLVIGAFGKRSTIDKALDRSFMKRRSPYVGIKYHIRSDFADDTVALHNFPGGYCGINKVEGDRYNLCYLSERRQLKAYGNIPDMEAAVLHRNPWLRSIFHNADFLLDQPEVINEITFEAKEPVFQGIIMVGDAAGMITPLCGNGMAMAIHGSKLLADNVAQYGYQTLGQRQRVQQAYDQQWRRKFGFRLASGRSIQRLFGGKKSSGLAVVLGKTVRPIAKMLMAQTHGEPFT